MKSQQDRKGLIGLPTAAGLVEEGFFQ